MKLSLPAVFLVCILATFATLATANPPAESPPTAPTTEQPPPSSFRIPVKLGDGNEFELEIVNEETHTGGETYREAEASGTGAGFKAQGDKIIENIDGSAPNASLDDLGDATGGGAKREGETKGDPSQAWKSPFLWLGAILCLAGGVCLFFKLRRPAIACFGAGAATIVITIWPWLMLVVLIVGLLIMFGPQILAELEARKQAREKLRYKEAGRALLAGENEMKEAHPAAFEFLKKATKRHAEGTDKQTIEEIKTEDGLH